MINFVSLVSFGIVAVGGMMNSAVIVANGMSMPVYSTENIPCEELENVGEGWLHHCATEDTKIGFLADRYELKETLIYSVGDVVAFMALPVHIAFLTFAILSRIQNKKGGELCTKSSIR